MDNETLSLTLMETIRWQQGTYQLPVPLQSGTTHAPQTEEPM